MQATVEHTTEPIARPVLDKNESSVGIRRTTRRWTIGAVLILLAILILQGPVIIWSLKTPFALVDDVQSSLVLTDLVHWKGFQHWLYARFVSFDPSLIATAGSPPGRFQLMYDVCNLINWRLLGNSPGLHHAMRLLFKFIIIAVTISMFRRYLSDRRVLAPSTLFFVALYAFFPNNPEARLAPQELLVVLFLSFHVYFMMGYLRPNSGCPHLAAFPSVRNYIGLFVSFCGLLWSKEPCLAFGAVTLTMLGWRPLIAFRSIRWRDVLSRIPFVLVFAHAFFKSYYISKAQGYGTAPLTSKLFQKNLNYYFDTLFLVHIGPFLWITALALLGLFVVVTLRVYWIRPMRSECRVDRRFVSPSSSTSLSSSIASAWALFGVFAIYGIAIFLMTLTSWIVVLRYVYPCVYCLCALMAIAMGEVCSHLNFRLAHPRSSQWRRIPGPIFGIACGLLATFFVAVNYYNFLSQYAVQYYTRKTEKRMLDGLAALLRSGQEVMLPVRYEHHASILAYWRQFLPELQQAGMIPQKFKWPPPTFPSGTLVVGMRESLPELPVYIEFRRKKLSVVMPWAQSLSGYLQRKPMPFTWRDAGAGNEIIGADWCIFQVP